MPGLHANSVASTFQRSFGTGMITGGVILCVFLAIVVFGGVKRIGKFAEKAAPIMCLVVHVDGDRNCCDLFQKYPGCNRPDLRFRVRGGCGVWRNRRFRDCVGSKKGCVLHRGRPRFWCDCIAAAEVTHPAKQGLVQALSVYIVSFIVCTSTAIILLLSNSYNVINETTGKMIVEYLPGSQYGVGWSQDILEATYGSLLGGKLFAIIIVLFVFTSLIGYEYQAESNVNYLFKGKKTAVWVIRKFLFRPLSQVFWLTQHISGRWEITGAGIMTWLSIIAVALMSKQAFAYLKIMRNRKNRERSVFIQSNLELTIRKESGRSKKNVIKLHI